MGAYAEQEYKKMMRDIDTVFGRIKEWAHQAKSIDAAIEGLDSRTRERIAQSGMEEAEWAEEMYQQNAGHKKITTLLFKGEEVYGPSHRLEKAEQ